MHVRGLAARGAVGDALAREPLEPVRGEAPPFHAAGDDDRARPQHVAAVEVHLAGGGVDARDRARHEHLGAQAPGLLQRAARELVARDARREAKVVLDARGRASLTARRLALDHDRAQTLGRAVDGSCQTRGAGADDHGVVLRARGLGCKAQQLGDAPEARAHDGLAAREADRRAVLRRREGAAPLLDRIRGVGREPCKGDLVAIEEAPQIPARASRRSPTTSARGGGGSAAMPCSPAAPVMRCAASAPISFARSGWVAATAW